MIQCQNCGRVNNYGSNFCRFCGTKFQVNQVSNRDVFENNAPRPYAWKTDEFQINDAPQVKQKTINRVQPPPFQYPASTPPQPLMQQPNYRQPPAYQNLPPQNSIAFGNNCPRCAGQAVRYERKISQTGWIVFAVLLVTFFPLFWIGFLIKEDVPVCQTCNFRFK